MKFYRISEFASLIGVSSSTLRNWEQQGILLPHHKTPTGYRYYSQEQLDNLMKSVRVDKENYNKS